MGNQLSIYEFKDYKLYLKKMAEERGFRAQMARAANCQTAYISQILNGNAHLSLEQAYSVVQILNLDKASERFFILMVEHGRAGTQNLKNFFLENMNELLSQQKNLKERFKVQEVLTSEQQTTYYSEWIFSAVHMALTVPKLRSIDALVQYFQISTSKIKKTLRFLESAGLAEQVNKDSYKVGPTRMHVGKDSPLVKPYHTNWRLRAIQTLDRESDQDIHYTSVVSLSRSDIEILQAKILKLIDDYNEVVKPSPEEALCCLSLDFFNLKE